MVRGCRCALRKVPQEAAFAEAAPLAAAASAPMRRMWDPLLAALASGHVWCACAAYGQVTCRTGKAMLCLSED